MIEEHIPLAPLTTFGIGGPARFFAEIKSVEELREALSFATHNALRVFVLGGGSNVLFDDTEFNGLIIKVGLRGVDIQEELFVAAAGEEWDALVAHAVEKGWWGIENLSGIPGTLGGAVVQNIGAYGAALSETVQWVEVYDTQKKETRRLIASECAFGYRDSVFKKEPGRLVVLRAAFSLNSSGTPNTTYKDLALRFGETEPTLSEVREAVLAIRAAKFPDLSMEGTAGSFFKNPIVSAAEANRLKERYPGLPTFSLPESKDIKIPLGWFLDYRNGVLDMRNVRIGGARLFEKQALVIAVQRGASSREVRALIHEIQEKVRSTLQLEVEPEVCIV